MRTVILILLSLLGINMMHAQSLSDKARMRLTEMVRIEYASNMMDGVSIHRIAHKDVLTSVVTVKRSSAMQRVAQVKAARLAGEFLQGACNHSVTVIEAVDNSTYSLGDYTAGSNATNNTSVSSSIEQDTQDATTTKSVEKFSDRIIQSSLTQVNHMQALTRFTGEEGWQVFVFYIIIK